jgi:DhnA family fructose-bisphosphate aldolase class Ia
MPTDARPAGPEPAEDPRWGPALILAADHRARGVITVERYTDYLAALTAAMPHADGILATAQPLADLRTAGVVTDRHRTYLSLNRTGLAGSVSELDDRLVASVERAALDGCTGVKLMTRIDYDDPHTSEALELLGRVLEQARSAGLEALIEAVTWRAGRMADATDDIVHAAVIAHDMGAPLLKVPIPAVPSGGARVDAVARVVASVGVPVLFLGGPRRRRGDSSVVTEVQDVMAGGAAGMAVGRAVLIDPDPAEAAQRIAAAVHGR